MADSLADLRRSVRYWKDAYQQVRDDNYGYHHEIQRLRTARDDNAARIRRMEREIHESETNLRAEVQRHREWRLEIQKERDESLVRIKELEVELRRVRDLEVRKWKAVAPQVSSTCI